MDPYDDGISLDTFVDWLIDAGQQIHRVDDYQDWLTRFETVLKTLSGKQRQYDVSSLLNAYREPAKPHRGAPAPADVFDTAVRAARIGVDNDIPHITSELIDKYVTDLHHLGLL